MRTLVACATVLLLACALPAVAATLTISNSGYGTTTVGGAGEFYFYNSYGSLYGPYNSGVPTFSSATATASLGTVNLPGGAVLTDAVLSWSVSLPSSGQVGASRSEYDWQYQSGGYQSCSWFSCHWYPTYSWGYGGSATIWNTNSAGLPTLSFNDPSNTTLTLGSLVGSVDLVQSGYAQDLLASSGLSFYVNEQSSLGITVNSWGYQAETFYYPNQVNNTIGVNASLALTYEVPPPARTPTTPGTVPEPASIALLGTGLLSIGKVIRRRVG